MRPDIDAAAKRPLIVLTVNNSWNILNFRADLVRRLQDEGYAIAVITPPDRHAPALASLGVEHVPAPMDSKGLNPLVDFTLLVRFWQILRRRRPVAILAWTIKPNIYASLAAHALRIPVLNNVSGLGTAFIRTGPLTALVSLLYRLAFFRSATVFFQNPVDRQTFVEKRLVDPNRTALLPGSGIDTARFAPVERDRAPTGPFAFLMVARLLRDKGVVEFVEAARLLRARGVNARFELLGFLDVDNRTAISRAQLQSWIDEGLIAYLGSVDDVRPFIAAADCIVLPSYREGMPRSLLEGAALGKPLIATRVPGCVEIARDGENALLCAVRDPASLADAMTRMVALSASERDAMGEAGRRIATAEFDHHIVAERYVERLEAAITA